MKPHIGQMVCWFDDGGYGPIASIVCSLANEDGIITIMPIDGMNNFRPCRYMGGIPYDNQKYVNVCFPPEYDVRVQDEIVWLKKQVTALVQKVLAEDWTASKSAVEAERQSTLSRDFEALRREAQFYADGLIAKNKELAEANMAIGSMKIEHEKYREQEQRNAKWLNERISELEGQHYLAKTDPVEYAAKLSNALAQLQEAKNETAEAEELIEDLHGEIKSKSDDIEILRTACRESTSNLNRKIAELETIGRKFVSDIVERDKKINDLAHRNELLVKDRGEAERQFQEQVALRGKEADYLNCLKKDVDFFAKQVGEKAAVISACEKESNELKKRLSVAEKHVADFVDVFKKGESMLWNRGFHS